jgi:glycosyltransferase 2 family protein
MRKIRSWKIINLVLLTLVLIFISRFLYKNLFALKDFNVRFISGYLVLSIIPIWIWLLITSYIFHLIMKKIIPSTNFRQSISVWSSSYLGTYIPGKIGVYAYRILFYDKIGVSPLKVTYGFFIEMVLSIISSIFVVLLAGIFFEPVIRNNYFIWIALFLITLMISIHPLLIRLYAGIWYRYFRKTGNYQITTYSYFFYLKICSLHIIKWCFAGLGIFLLINSVTDLSLKYFPFITGLYAAAAVIGLLAFFAPSGIGVVEGVMIVGLKTIMSNSLAGLISIFVRLWKITGELTFIFLIKFFLRRRDILPVVAEIE